jgi:hypothetical protein
LNKKINIELDTESILYRMISLLRQTLPKAIKTSIWLLKIMIPVSFMILVLDYTGLLSQVAGAIAPFFKWLGLPGESAFVLLTSIFTNIYSAIAVISTVGFQVREATIMAVMCLIAHGFIVETAVVRKTGSNAVQMILLRLAASIAAGIVLNAVLPEIPGNIGTKTHTNSIAITDALIQWSISTFWLCLKIVLIVVSLMFVQRMLEHFGVIAIMKKPLLPLMKVMGLAPSTTFSWIVGNTLGLAYGSAIIIEEVNEGRMTKEDADLLNHHLVISHSQLEDTLLFAAIGLPVVWLMLPRFLIAVIAVWLRRSYLTLLRKHKTG